MAKYDLRIKARELRSKGISVKTISQLLGIAKSTASVWVRDIILTIDQLEQLRQNALLGSEKGRLKSALLQKEKWNLKLQEAKEQGKEIIGVLNDRELLIAGLSLYWAEGSKKKRTIELCNSDPKMIQFFILWLQKTFGIEIQELRCRVGINSIHKSRDEEVKQYWSYILKIPLSQFTNTSYKRVVNKKVYSNPELHFGTLSVYVKNSSRFYTKILGLIDGLHNAYLPG